MAADPEIFSGLSGSGLAVQRGSQTLFSGLNFAVPHGSLCWIRGPNGSGKTTLLRMVAGLVAPEQGTLQWVATPKQQGPDVSRNLIYIGHNSALKDDLTALEALTFLVELHGACCTPLQAAQALKEFGIHHRRHLQVRNLSQGQRKRVALARLVLSGNAPLWVLDEPFDALDDEGVVTLRALLQSHVKRGGIVLLTSHIPVELPDSPVIPLDLSLTAAGVRRQELA